MRNLVKSIVLIILLVFYCFEKNINSSGAEFHKITQPTESGNRFLQTLNNCNFCFITKDKNINPDLPKQKVFAGKKHLNYIHKTILTRITFHGLIKGKYFMTEQYSFILTSYVLLMIIPFHWFT